MTFEVRLFEQAADFILHLPVKMQAKVQRTIGLLKEFGFELPMPHSRRINRDLRELRIKVGSDICRLFYFHWKERIYVITSGFVKKTAKTDPEEISRAMKLMTRFKEQSRG